MLNWALLFFYAQNLVAIRMLSLPGPIRFAWYELEHPTQSIRVGGQADGGVIVRRLITLGWKIREAEHVAEIARDVFAGKRRRVLGGPHWKPELIEQLIASAPK
ncbi:MAG: hypothetical protein HYV07_07810 [Deltaproteobacteria bacterium]|nr:hypothetical protein [Deltaproteobacteria bacterium]